MYCSVKTAWCTFFRKINVFEVLSEGFLGGFTTIFVKFPFACSKTQVSLLLSNSFHLLELWLVVTFVDMIIVLLTSPTEV